MPQTERLWGQETTCSAQKLVLGKSLHLIRLRARCTKMKKIEYYQNETVGASYRHDLSRMTNQTYFFNVEAVPLSS